MLSSVQLPLFLILPPRGFGVITTTGRRSGRRRRRCIRAIRRGDRVFAVAIKGSRTGWLRNVEANPRVHLRVRGGTFTADGRRPRNDRELREARDTYCGTVNRLDYLECVLWRGGRPSRRKIAELHESWMEHGAPLVFELVSAPGGSSDPPLAR